MRSKGLRAAIFAALVLTLVLVGSGLWGDSSAPRAVDEHASVREESAGSSGAAPDPELPDSNVREPRGSETPNEQKPKVNGRVESRDGVAVAGVHVVALSDEGKVRDTVVTDADGRFEFDIRGRARIGIAHFPKLNKVARGRVQFEAGGSDSVLAFEGIAGTVAAGDGSLLTSGVVLARFAGEDTIVANAPISAEGAFAFARLQPGRYLLTYKSHVYGSEYDMTDGGIELEEWRTGVELRLADGATIEGVVLDEHGKPKHKVWMRVTRGSVLTGDYTDEEGRFRVEGLVPDKSYTLTVWLRGFVPEQREARAGERDIRFSLDPGLRTTGVLRGSDGLAVVGKQLFFRFGDGAQTSLYATTDASGLFEVGGLPDQRIEALVAQGEMVSCGSFRAGDRDVELQLPPP